MRHVKGDMKGLTKVAAKGLIPVRLVTPEAEITMYRLDLIVQICQHPQQSDTVRSSGQSHKV
jgi:hypothetical protein